MKFCWIALLFMSLSSAQSQAQEQVRSLPLTQFLQQVQEKNENYKSLQLSLQTAQVKSNEAKLLTMPTGLASYGRTVDEKPRTSLLQGKTLKVDTMTMAISQQTVWGPSAKVGYSYVHTNTGSPTSATSPYNNYYTASPFIELKIPLYRNFLGDETRNMQEVLRKNYEAQEQSKIFEVKVLLAQAEMAYWQLVLARQTARLQQEAELRYQKMRDWNGGRVNKGLADKADLLQAEAALQYKKYDRKQAEDDEKIATRQFNLLRGVSGDEVAESLDAIDEEHLQLASNKSLALAKKEEREDLKALRLQRDASIAQSSLSHAKTETQIDLVGAYATNSLERTQGKAVAESTDTEHPNWSLALTLTAPLDIFTANDLRSAYHQDQNSAEISFRRKQFENEKTWQDLNAALADACSRYQLAKRMEELQSQKLSYEKERLYRGRTVTYQVLQFEIDYTNAQLLKLKEQAKIISLINSIKLFL